MFLNGLDSFALPCVWESITALLKLCSLLNDSKTTVARVERAFRLALKDREPTPPSLR